MTAEQTERCKRALQAFDAANSQDPTLEPWQDQTQPAALLYGWRMSDRLRQFVCTLPKLCNWPPAPSISSAGVFPRTTLSDESPGLSSVASPSGRISR
ncbi:MAG: hypothetical protein R3F53_14220 [Gammaproteobacteria bacterium]